VTARLAFIDWMKAAGMFMIVFGHVVGGPVDYLTPPIYQKQLGVAFFLFVTGYTLARETRPTAQVVVQRLFEMVLVGGAFAVLATLASLMAGGRGQLSNYLPLLFGANVLFNSFPVNPTTWYIGTYIHLMVAWALVRRHFRPTLAWVVVAAVAEPLVRALLWDAAGSLVAYMALTNWMAVTLLGCYAGGRPRDAPLPAWGTGLAAAAAAAPLLLAAVAPYDHEFPFRTWSADGPAARLVSSAGVTALYLGMTWLAFRLASRLSASRLVERLSSQTLIIFVAHMPLYYVLLAYVGGWPRWQRAPLLLLVCYPGLALAGEMLHRLAPIGALRQRAVAWLAVPAARA
jgi:hypothetical protein